MSEELSFDKLAKWSQNRWLAGTHEESDKIKERAIALATVKYPTKTVERNEKTGELILIDDEEMLKRIQDEEDAKKKQEAEKEELESLRAEHAKNSQHKKGK
jgi:hypothetical protein